PPPSGRSSSLKLRRMMTRLLLFHHLQDTTVRCGFGFDDFTIDYRRFERARFIQLVSCCFDHLRRIDHSAGRLSARNDREADKKERQLKDACREYGSV